MQSHAAASEVIRATTAVGEQYYEAASAVGLTVQEARLLYVLGLEPSNMLGLTAALKVPKSTMTGLVARLETAGLITREQDPRDRRHLITTPTARGRAVAGNFARDVAARTTRILSSLGEGEKSELAEILSDVLVGIERVGELAD